MRGIQIKRHLLTVSLLAMTAGPAFAQDMAPVTTTVDQSPHMLGTINKDDLAAYPIMPTTQSTQVEEPVDALQPQQVGNITYVTGGIGDEERSALEAVQQNYNLHVTSADKDGAFVSDTTIVISNKGNQLLSTVVGPLFYAQLPNGSYKIEASHSGQSQTRNITVTGKKPALLHFGW